MIANTARAGMIYNTIVVRIKRGNYFVHIIRYNWMNMCFQNNTLTLCMRCLLTIIFLISFVLNIPLWIKCDSNLSLTVQNDKKKQVSSDNDSNKAEMVTFKSYKIHLYMNV